MINTQLNIAENRAFVIQIHIWNNYSLMTAGTIWQMPLLITSKISQWFCQRMGRDTASFCHFLFWSPCQGKMERGSMLQLSIVASEWKFEQIVRLIAFLSNWAAEQFSLSWWLICVYPTILCAHLGCRTHWGTRGLEQDEMIWLSLCLKFSQNVERWIAKFSIDC